MTVYSEEHIGRLHKAAKEIGIRHYTRSEVFSGRFPGVHFSTWDNKIYYHANDMPQISRKEEEMRPRGTSPYDAVPIETLEDYRESVKEVEKQKVDTGAIPEPIKTASPIILVAIFIGVLGYMLFGNVRKG